MKLIAGLALAGCLLILSGCGNEACDNLPVCLNPQRGETQPAGGVQGSRVIELSPGERQGVTLTISRVGLSPDQPAFFKPLGPEMGSETVLARTPDGTITVTGAPSRSRATRPRFR